MPLKHSRAQEQEDDAPAQAKRQRLSAPFVSSRPQKPTAISPRTGADLLSPLSDELLVRILSYLSLPGLLGVAPLSQRFHRLSEDSQLWKALYYARFVLPRAMRIPGFREGKMDAARMRDHKLHYKGRRNLWADGRLGGLVRDAERNAVLGRINLDHNTSEADDRIHWKRQYKIRHNWARGKCAVEELELGAEPQLEHNVPEADDEDDRSKMLVKVVEGVAVTADRIHGLRAWDLKTRDVMAKINLHAETKGDEECSGPSCLAIDDREHERGSLNISVGFADGSFGVWRLHLQEKSFVERYRHEKSSNGELLGLSYSHPYLLTATGAVLISLYTFDVPEMAEAGPDSGESVDNTRSKFLSMDEHCETEAGTTHDGASLPPPYLMTSLKSYTSDPPLALSIRKTARTTVASIAYTFFTRQGWSIGIQDLNITPNDNPKCAPNISTRLAYTTPFHTGGSPPQPSTSTRTPGRSGTATLAQDRPPSLSLSSASGATTQAQAPPRDQSGPTTLCYAHPYLLATLPDNTLILHLCRSNASALSVSPGIRLWGHTSGISTAEITARGKAVSVSSRGEEMRVWELEGRPSGRRSESVEIRPGGGGLLGSGSGDQPATTTTPVKEKGLVGDAEVDWEERRNWVGFDDEMVIVLKEARGGRESLLVYDFT